MSKHHDFYEDRLWAFSCKPTINPSGDCFFSSYINNFDQAFSFACPPHYAIAGMNSYHSIFYEDRRWQFYCCRSSCISNNCQWTSHVNWFDETFFWNVPHHNVLVGAGSYHQDFYDNRRWR
ncbi:hemagglutinin/amebocyte aggregation factor-like isoform X2 [Labeo rohita]|nr:hemagglutinin/amebocyte aggregation factor-like isoform X2 [Labeo rohita]